MHGRLHTLTEAVADEPPEFKATAECYLAGTVTMGAWVVSVISARAIA